MSTICHPSRNFTAGSSRVHYTTCCVHWVLPVQARPSTCHGYGNSLRRIDSEQVEGLALEGGGLGGDGDGGLRLGGQSEPVQSDGGEIPQQGREAVHGKTLRCGLGVGLARLRSSDAKDDLTSATRGRTTWRK